MGDQSQFHYSFTKMILLLVAVLATITNGNPANVQRQLPCPDNSMPVTCGDDMQMCPGPIVDGCPMADTCVLNSTPNGEGECMGNCPVTCNSNELLCAGSIVGGCPMADTCVPMSTPNGEGECMGNCPVTCNSNELLCAGSMVDGCPMADTCVPMSTPNGDGE